MPFVENLQETSAMKYCRYVINNVVINLMIMIIKTGRGALRKYVPPADVHQKWILKGLSVLSDRWAFRIAQKKFLGVFLSRFPPEFCLLYFRLLDSK